MPGICGDHQCANHLCDKTNSKGKRSDHFLPSIPTAATRHTAATLGLGERKNRREVGRSAVVWLLRSGQSRRKPPRGAEGFLPHALYCSAWAVGCCAPTQHHEGWFPLTQKSPAVQATLQGSVPPAIQAQGLCSLAARSQTCGLWSAVRWRAGVPPPVPETTRGTCHVCSHFLGHL